MTGSATYARDADVAAAAREQLDRAAAAVAGLETAQRSALREVIGLWPTSAWLAAGASSAKRWLMAYTSLSYRDAARLERIAGVCASQPDLADAVVSGTLPLRRADVLCRAVTPERARFLAGSLPALLRLGAAAGSDDSFDTAVRFWVERVDEQLAPRRVQPHSLTFAERLFGGGQIHGDLAPVAFATVRAAVDAWTQDPDPADAPCVRTLSERRADALDDLAHFALTHHDDEMTRGTTAWTGTSSTPRTPSTVRTPATTSTRLSPLSAPTGSPGPTMSIRLSCCAGGCAGPRTTVVDEPGGGSGPGRVPWSTSTSTCASFPVSDPPTISTISCSAARGGGSPEAQPSACSATRSWLPPCSTARRRCSTPTRPPSGSPARNAEPSRRETGHCVFPSCTRQPRHCDAHHLQHREHDGPTRVDNGALLCRFHHRLVHEYGWRLLVDDSGHWVALDRHGTRWTGRPVAAGPTGPPVTRRPTHQDAP